MVRKDSKKLGNFYCGCTEAVAIAVSSLPYAFLGRGFLTADALGDEGDTEQHDQAWKRVFFPLVNLFICLVIPCSIYLFDVEVFQWCITVIFRVFDLIMVVVDISYDAFVAF